MIRWGSLSRRAAMRGQSLVEFALLLPVLLGVLMMIMEGGMIFSSYNALVTATWSGARFLVDGGSEADMVSLVQSASPRIPVNGSCADIFVVRGGKVGLYAATWDATHVLDGPGGSIPTAATDKRTQIESGLYSTMGSSDSIEFILVEIDYQYHSSIGSWVLPVTVPMSSYALVPKP